MAPSQLPYSVVVKHRGGDILHWPAALRLLEFFDVVVCHSAAALLFDIGRGVLSHQHPPGSDHVHLPWSLE